MFFIIKIPGAYGAIMDDDDAAEKFCEEDIEQILSNRATTIKHEAGIKGSTFSKATFAGAADSRTVKKYFLLLIGIILQNLHLLNLTKFTLAKLSIFINV